MNLKRDINPRVNPLTTDPPKSLTVAVEIFRDFISEMFLSLLLCTFFGTTIAVWINFLVIPCIIIVYFPRSGKADMVTLFPGDKWEHYASGVTQD